VVASVLKRDVYSGRTFVVNDWYLTQYDPIRDDHGAGAYEDDFQDAIGTIRRSFDSLTLLAVATGLAVLLVLGTVTALTTRRSPGHSG
jgi:hypothetical protein